MIGEKKEAISMIFSECLNISWTGSDKQHVMMVCAFYFKR